MLLELFLPYYSVESDVDWCSTFVKIGYMRFNSNLKKLNKDNKLRNC
jgi:hypothetical protein